ncbi:hypothetical protein Q7P37_000002 [Cladosporium fusiforme]
MAQRFLPRFIASLKRAKAAKSHNSKYDVEWRTEKQRSEHRKKAARGRQAGSGSQEKGHSLEEDAGGISSFEKQVSCSSALYQDVQSEINPRVDLGHEWDGEASWAAHGPQSHFDFRGKAEGTGDGGSQLGCCINHDQRSCPTKVTNAGFMADDFSRCQIIHDQGNATGDKTRSRRANLDALDLPTDTTSQRQDHHDASLDLAICRRHLDLVKAYTDRVRGDFDDQSEHQVRKAWLRLTTQWAKIYAGPGSALGHRDSVTESDADVVYTSSQEFLRLSRQDKVFSKPVVIKENFADAGIFTLNEFVRALGHSTTESIDVSAFIQMLQAEAAPEPGSRNYGLNALDFHGITSCSRPAFTHLLRYRLLETLSEAAIKGGPGKRISRGGRPVPFDITGSLSFNILGLDGAFSPPHMDALTGTKERLVVLEPNDVLLMPLGLRVIHAVYTPQSSLMEGGMIWDELNILETLTLLNDIHQHQHSTNESVPYQLYNIVAELEVMVHADPGRFACRSKDFTARFTAAIDALKQRGPTLHTILL